MPSMADSRVLCIRCHPMVKKKRSGKQSRTSSRKGGRKVPASEIDSVRSASLWLLTTARNLEQNYLPQLGEFVYFVPAVHAAYRMRVVLPYFKDECDYTSKAYKRFDKKVKCEVQGFMYENCVWSGTVVVTCVKLTLVPTQRNDIPNIVVRVMPKVESDGSFTVSEDEFLFPASVVEDGEKRVEENEWCVGKQVCVFFAEGSSYGKYLGSIEKLDKKSMTKAVTVKWDDVQSPPTELAIWELFPVDCEQNEPYALPSLGELATGYIDSLQTFVNEKGSLSNMYPKVIPNVIYVPLDMNCVLERIGNSFYRTEKSILRDIREIKANIQRIHLEDRTWDIVQDNVESLLRELDPEEQEAVVKNEEVEKKRSRDEDEESAPEQEPEKKRARVDDTAVESRDVNAVRQLEEVEHQVQLKNNSEERRDVEGDRVENVSSIGSVRGEDDSVYSVGRSERDSEGIARVLERTFSDAESERQSVVRTGTKIRVVRSGARRRAASSVASSETGDGRTRASVYDIDIPVRRLSRPVDTREAPLFGVDGRLWFQTIFRRKKTAVPVSAESEDNKETVETEIHEESLSPMKVDDEEKSALMDRAESVSAAEIVNHGESVGETESLKRSVSLCIAVGMKIPQVREDVSTEWSVLLSKDDMKLLYDHQKVCLPFFSDKIELDCYHHTFHFCVQCSSRMEEDLSSVVTLKYPYVCKAREALCAMKEMCSQRLRIIRNEKALISFVSSSFGATEEGVIEHFMRMISEGYTFMEEFACYIKKSRVMLDHPFVMSCVQVDIVVFTDDVILHV